MNTTPAYHDDALIFQFDSDAVSVLLLKTGTGYTLPHFIHPPHFWQTCAPLHQSLREQYGLHTAVLRCLHTQYAEPDYHRLYALELLSGTLPDHAVWMPFDMLSSLSVDGPYDLPALASIYQHAHELRPAWAQPGRVDRLLIELPTVLNAAGYTLNGPFDHLRAWERGTVLRLPTNRGHVYLKGVPDMFAHEPGLTAWLAQNYPENSPQVLDTPGYFIMAEYAGKPLNELPDVALWAEALRTYARLQINTITRTDELYATGVPERSINWLKSGALALFNDEATLTCGLFPLNADEIARLRGLIPRIQSACHALQNGLIPAALEHGDLWQGQIIVDGSRYIITDWSDSTITCPLFSLPFFVAEIAGDMPDVPDAKPRLVEAYLSEWTGFAPMEALRALVPHVELLSPLFSAVRYYRDILPHMEQKWEMENMLAYNLRLLLRNV